MGDYETALRLENMRQMFLCGSSLYSWYLSQDFSLRYSNCPSEKFFYDMLMISSCRTAMEKHVLQNSEPIILNDQMGFAWIASAEKDADDVFTGLHLLGPFFTVEASEAYLRDLCNKLRISQDLSSELIQQLKFVPTVPLNMALRYAVMLHYCVSGEQISLTDVVYEHTASQQEQESEWSSTNWHGTWEAEQMMFDGIRTGTMTLSPDAMELTKQFAHGRVGTMSPGDPLRQAKDELIVLAVLCSRAAILGGVSPEGGYNIADYYIQRGEACETVSAVQACQIELLQIVLQRVRKCRSNKDKSALVAACMEYVETHVLEKIRFEDMARDLGYAGYYLSKQFKKETGTALKDYINEQKIEYAKRLLDTTQTGVVEISERLAFSSPSYFGVIFQEYTGMTPSEYRSRAFETDRRTEQ